MMRFVTAAPYGNAIKNTLVVGKLTLTWDVKL